MGGEDTEPPYLSIVVAARNDDHGGNFLRRIQLFVDNVALQCDRHAIAAELVLVEWNPPADRPRLGEAISWPPSERCRMRIVEVPAELHALHLHAERLPLFQMIAKNVGIRRAQGHFVLATNVDVLLSDELAAALAQPRLDPACVYRVDRYDVDEATEWPESPESQLRACAAHVVRINRREATTDLRTGEVFPIYGAAPRLRSWLAQPWRSVRVVLGELKLSLRRVVLALAWPAERGERQLVNTGKSELGRLLAGVRKRRLGRELHRALGRLHTNACGDFTLMARERWHELRGYPEFHLSPWFIDSMLLYCAHYGGLAEVFLPYPLYHVEHARFDDPQVPKVTYPELGAWAVTMFRSRSPIVANAEDWGFASYDLAEILPGSERAASV